MRAAVSLVLAAIFSILIGTAMAEEAEEGVPPPKLKTAPYPSDIVYGGTGMPVVFSHDMHAGGLGLTCDACHPDVFLPETYAARSNGDFKMRAMQDGDYCGRCHDGETAFSSGDFAECGRCHAGSPPKPEVVKVVGPEDTITVGYDSSAAGFRHTSHEVFECKKCHSGLFPMKKTETITTMEDINAGKSCGICHNGSLAFDQTNCSSCHPAM